MQRWTVFAAGCIRVAQAFSKGKKKSHALSIHFIFHHFITLDRFQTHLQFMRGTKISGTEVKRGMVVERKGFVVAWTCFIVVRQYWDSVCCCQSDLHRKAARSHVCYALDSRSSSCDHPGRF
jgi:hypothetical protein